MTSRFVKGLAALNATLKERDDATTEVYIYTIYILYTTFCSELERLAQSQASSVRHLQQTLDSGRYSAVTAESTPPPSRPTPKKVEF